MKDILLSVDDEIRVYSVPNEVAINLSRYCYDFIHWMEQSPDAEKYRENGVFCYNEDDFIMYLNNYVFKDNSSKDLFYKEFGSQ